MVICDREFGKVPTQLGALLHHNEALTLPPITGERRAKLLAYRAESEARAARVVRADVERALFRICGVRYEPCTFESFVFSADPEIATRQAAAIAKAKIYASHIRAVAGTCRNFGTEPRVAGTGENLVLYGPRGTGKDHILIAVLREAINANLDVEWFSGFALLAEIEEFKRIEGLRRFSWPSVAGLSDPIPPGGPLSERQAHAMLVLLDERYRQRRPTIITVNVKNRSQLEERLGPAAVDRVLESAVSVYFNWPSWREQPTKISDEASPQTELILGSEAGSV